MKPKLLIVDDDEEIRAQMRWALANDCDISLVEDRAGAIQISSGLEKPPVGAARPGLAARSRLA